MPKKILLVDDEIEIQKMLVNRLSFAGYEVETASSGSEAIGAYIASLTKEPYALILLDIMMPDVDGLEVLKVIRKEEELHGIRYGEGVPIIMLTALQQPWMESFKRGCDDYVVKPFQSDALMKLIESKIKK